MKAGRGALLGPVETLGAASGAPRGGPKGRRSPRPAGLMTQEGTGMALPLAGRVAVVTGASRGVGRGIALGLGEAGATVYVTGRTVEEGTAAVPLPGTIGETAADVTRLGGQGIAVRCDHRDDDQVR